MLKKHSAAQIVLILILSLTFMASAACAESQGASEPQTFTGSATGYGGSIRVTVTVADGELVDLTAVGLGETDGIGTTAVEKMAAAMLESKSFDVDMVTGATLSSEGMKEAARKAMDAAGLLDEPEAEAESVSEPQTFTESATGYGGSIRVTVTVADGELVDLTAIGRGETDGIGSVAVEKMAAAMLEAKHWDVDMVTGATLTGEGMKEAAQKAMEAAGLLDEPETEDASEPQTFTGSATGYGGSIRVTITVADGELVDLTAVGLGETDGIGSVAVEKMAAAMLEAKSFDVDMVTGATMTGEGMKEAAKKAMTQAGLVEEAP